MPAVRDMISSLNGLTWTRFPAAARARRTHARSPRPAPVESRYARAGTEPGLGEALADPIVELVMRADRLEPGEVRQMLEARQGLPA